MPIFVLIPFSLCYRDQFFSFLALENLSFASDQPLHIQILDLIEQLILLLYIDIHQFERISDEVKLDLVIEGSVGGEARSVVDFQENGFC